MAFIGIGVRHGPVSKEVNVVAYITVGRHNGRQKGLNLIVVAILSFVNKNKGRVDVLDGIVEKDIEDYIDNFNDKVRNVVRRIDYNILLHHFNYFGIGTFVIRTVPY